MDITRENLKKVKEEIIRKIKTEEELNKIKDQLHNEAVILIDEFNNSNNEGDYIDE